MPTDSAFARLRLFQLVSPSLPLGGYAYSQGLEWAIEAGWIHNETSLREWIENLLGSSLSHLDIPLMARLYRAGAAMDPEAFAYWSDYLVASRETRELREEEHNRARALTALLPELGIAIPDELLPALKKSQLSGFAYAAQQWRIGCAEAAEGYLWSWLENITLAGVKIVPLGQTAGQRIMSETALLIPQLVETGLTLDDEEIGASSPAQAIASSLHETQYTRIFRS